MCIAVVGSQPGEVNPIQRDLVQNHALVVGYQLLYIGLFGHSSSDAFEYDTGADIYHDVFRVLHFNAVVYAD